MVNKLFIVIFQIEMDCKVVLTFKIITSIVTYSRLSFIGGEFKDRKSSWLLHFRWWFCF